MVKNMAHNIFDLSIFHDDLILEQKECSILYSAKMMYF